ncbi:MAG: ABC transporter ATP-binding protein [Cyanobacteria bacterium P01_H01_bin.74]
MSAQTSQPLLSVDNLSIAFPTANGLAYAVNQFSYQLWPQEVLGIVGESGCGKSLSSLAILRLIPSPGKILSGEILFDGHDLMHFSEQSMRKIRGAKIAFIPQDPLSALNPVYTVGNQIIEIIRLHQHLSHQAAQKLAIDLLDRVRIPEAKSRLNAYPHEFSGGMRQRVMIAMALSCNPMLIIADEPTTALDVTVQAQILDLLHEIRQTMKTAVIFITHDLGVVAETCDRVLVMYAGRCIEEASVQALFETPKHPYTRGLLEALPSKNKSRLTPIEGQPPRLTEMPAGCAFEPRCAERMNVCKSAPPTKTALDKTTREQNKKDEEADETPMTEQKVACYLYDDAQ